MQLRTIEAEAAELGIGRGDLLPHGRGKAKVARDAIGPPHGELVAGGAITPTRAGAGGLPVGVGKTPASLSDDPRRRGRPSGIRVTVREARLSAGASCVVARLGDVETMSGPHGGRRRPTCGWTPTARCAGSRGRSNACRRW